MTVAILASSHNIKTLDPIDKVTVLSLKGGSVITSPSFVALLNLQQIIPERKKI